MRTYSGKILLRLPPEVHKELAREAFEGGLSINQLCLEAIFARRALKSYDPWKSIEKLWAKNRKADPAKMAAEIREAVKKARRSQTGRKPRCAGFHGGYEGGPA